MPAPRYALPHSGGDLSVLSDGQWRLQTGVTSIVWASPPTALHSLIFELFATRPQDVLSWAHSAVWRLREDSWRNAATVDLEGDSSDNSATSAVPWELSYDRKAGYSLERGAKGVHPGRLQGGNKRVDTTRVSYKIYADQQGLTGEGASRQASPCSSSPTPYSSDRKNRHSRSVTSCASVTSNAPSNYSHITSGLILDDDLERTNSAGSNFTVQTLVTPLDMNRRRSGSRSAPISIYGSSQECYMAAKMRERTKTNHQRSLVPDTMPSSKSVKGMTSNASEDVSAGPFLQHFKTFGKIVTSFSVLRANSALAEYVFFDCFSPLSWTCFLWGGVFAIAVLFELWAYPFELVFWASDLPEWTFESDVALFSVFLFDILLNLCTGRISDGILVIKWPIAIRWYVHGWLWCDLFATMPYIACIASSGRSEAARCCFIVRALRLIRVKEWISHVPLFCGWLRPLIHLFKLKLGLVVIAHLFAVLFALMQPSEWIDGHQDGAYGCYLQCLWWSFAALTCGSIPRGSSEQRQMVLEILVASARVILLLIALDWTKSNSVIHFGTGIAGTVGKVGKEELGSTQDHLMSYLSKRKVKPSLQLQVLQALVESRQSQQEQSRINWLANQNIHPRVRYELSRGLWARRIMTIGIMTPLVQWYSAFAVELAAFAQEVTISPGTVLFKAGDPTLTAYLILSGVLAVRSSNDIRFLDYIAGMWVGEQALVSPELLHSETLTCSVRAALMAIHAADFRKLLAKHNLAEDFEHYLQQTLWMGLCGRCGLFGDHFTSQCPHAGQTGGFWSRFVRKTPRPTSNTISPDLDNFLHEVGLSNLGPDLPKHQIRNMNDLNASAMDDFLDGESSQILQADKERLRKAVGKLRKKVVEGTTALMQTTSSADHFIFISHYKVEAGTEATLIQRDLEHYIEKDPTLPGHGLGLEYPIFVDSENLTNLGDLHACVCRSYNVLLLLTPGVLKRPWVLVEIALAFRNGTNVVPVEVQRPDLAFRFPDEAYFRGIGTGEELDAGCLELLSSEQIELSDLEAALRHSFKLIASPFSPHKPASIRDAELREILRRCTDRAPRVTGTYSPRRTTGGGITRSMASNKTATSTDMSSEQNSMELSRGQTQSQTKSQKKVVRTVSMNGNGKRTTAVSFKSLLSRTMTKSSFGRCSESDGEGSNTESYAMSSRLSLPASQLMERVRPQRQQTQQTWAESDTSASSKTATSNVFGMFRSLGK